MFKIKGNQGEVADSIITSLRVDTLKEGEMVEKTLLEQLEYWNNWSSDVKIDISTKSM